MKVKEMIKKLQQRDPEETILCPLWQIGDVILRASELDEEINEDQAKAVLENLEHNHDCCYGITWDHIDDGIDCILEEGI